MESTTNGHSRTTTPRRKHALVLIKGDEDLVGRLKRNLLLLGLQPVHKPAEEGEEQPEIVIVNDLETLGSYLDRDSFTPIIYVGDLVVGDQRVTGAQNVYPVKGFLDIVQSVREALRQRDSTLSDIGRVVMPSDREAAQMITLGIHHLLDGVETGSDPERAEQDYRRALKMGGQLETLLRTSRGEFSVQLGESEHHERSGHRLANVFVRMFHDDARWGHKDIAETRYGDAGRFGKDQNFPVARAYKPLHYQDTQYPGRAHSIVLFDYINGPTLSKVLFRIKNRVKAIEKGRRSQERMPEKDLLVQLARGLLRREIEHLKYWTRYAPKGLRHSGEEVQADYVHALQHIPDIFRAQLKPGAFSSAEEGLWRQAVQGIISYVDFDDRFIVRYRDTAPTNVILAVSGWDEKPGLHHILHEFTGGTKIEGRSVHVTERTRLDYRLENMRRPDRRFLNIDTGHRGAHWLEDFYHLLVSHEAWKLAGRYLERNFRRGFVEHIAELKGFDPERDAGDIDVLSAVMGFYRSTRKCGNLVDFGQNAFDDLRSRKITPERCAGQIQKFDGDMLHYLARSTDMLKGIIELSLPKIDEQEMCDVLRSALTRRQIPLNESYANYYTERLGRLTDEHARLAFHAVIATAYVSKLRGEFRSVGGLHYG